MENLKKSFTDIKSIFISSFFLKNFTVVFLTYLLGVSAILRVNYDYIDDMLRIYNGSRGWDNFCRYLTEYGSILIHGNTVLSDISPLPQVIAIAIMAFTVSVIIYFISKQKQFSFFYVYAAIPFALSPYFLECIAFKFDSPYMAFSVLATVFPIFFFDKDSNMFYLSSFLGGLLMCLSYQASSAIYFIVLSIYGLLLWLNGGNERCLFRRCFFGLISYGAALALYKRTILTTMMGYVTTFQLTLSCLPKTISDNIVLFMEMFIADHPQYWILLIVVFIIAFLIVVTVNSSRNFILSLCVSVIVVFIALSFSQGAYLVLKRTYLEPRAMYGIWCAVSIMMIAGVSFQHKTFLVKTICVVLSWCVFTFSFMYGNALEKQRNYTDRRVQSLINDLNHTVFCDNHNDFYLKIKGTVGYSTTVERLFCNYPVMKRLIPVLLREAPDDNDILYNDLYLFLNNYLPNVQKSFFTEQDIEKMQFELICQTGMHDILLDKKNKCVLVILK